MPWKIAELLVAGDDDKAIEWCESEQQDHRFKPNDEVADKMCPDHKMVVKEIKYQSHNVDKTKNERMNRIIGIECYWWVDAKAEMIEKEIRDV